MFILVKRIEVEFFFFFKKGKRRLKKILKLVKFEYNMCNLIKIEMFICILIYECIVKFLDYCL